MKSKQLLENMFGELRQMLSGDAERSTTTQIGIMVSKFLITDADVRLISLSGDVKGVTGYSVEEFKRLDIMRVLGIQTNQIRAIVTKVESTGFCFKETTFILKSGQSKQVQSLVIKICDNQYTEYTWWKERAIRL